MSIESFTCGMYYMYGQLCIASGKVDPDDMLWTNDDLERGYFRRGHFAALAIPYSSGNAVLHVATVNPPAVSETQYVRAYSFPLVVHEQRIGFGTGGDPAFRVQARLDDGDYLLTVRVRMEVDTKDGARDITDQRELDQLEESDFRTFIEVYLERVAG